jgi:hypothetical protein
MFATNVMGALAHVYEPDTSGESNAPAYSQAGPPALTAVEYREKLDVQRMKFENLNGRATAMRMRREELAREVALAKARLALAPEVIEFLDTFQKKAHEETLDEFRALTTSIIQDVFPGNNVATYHLYSLGNVAALDIGLQVDGQDEDIMTMNGGAMTNVICTGLHYIARDRTDSRNFLGLDEPDCWMNLEYVPPFVKVISDVSRTKQIQTLIVSHHPVEILEAEGVNVIEMRPDASGKIAASPMNPQAPSWESDEQEGLRFIELVNIGKHAHTFIPLFPGVNALSAPNQGGKSTVMAALRFAFYNRNDANDGIIAHKAAEGIIRVGLERGRVVEVKIKRKGSPKVEFSLTGPDISEPREQRGERGKPVPDFIQEALRVSPVDGLELHLAMQKEPVFLLNQPSTARAKLLSVGRESGFLTAMRERHRLWVTRDNEKVRTGEAELMGLNRKLAAIEDLKGVEPLMQMMFKLLNEVEQAEFAKTRVASLIGKLESCAAEVKSLGEKHAILSNLPTAIPELHQQGHLVRLIERIASAAKVADLRCDVTWPEVPVLTDNRPIVELGKKIATLEKHLSAVGQPPALDIRVPELAGTEKLSRVVSMLGKTAAETTTLEQENKKVARELSVAEKEHQSLIDSLGGMCPLCGGTMTSHSH